MAIKVCAIDGVNLKHIELFKTKYVKAHFYDIEEAPSIKANMKMRTRGR